MKIQNNDTKDEGLKGNEKIEEAISALQQEASQELLAHTLTVIRRRMKEEGQLILAVILQGILFAQHLEFRLNFHDRTLIISHHCVDRL